MLCFDFLRQKEGMHFSNNFISRIYITKKRKTETLFNPVFHKQSSREYAGPILGCSITEIC